MVYAKTTWVTAATPISAANLNKIETQYNNIVTIGEIKMYAGTTAPTDFLLCNGSSYNAATYAALFAVTSYRFGGSLSTFKVPDLQGKFIVGYNSTNTDYDVVGESGGSSDVVITAAQLAAHVHNFDILDIWGWNVYGLPGIYTNTNASLNLEKFYTEWVGAGGAHENVPQYVTVNYIIRYQ
jgi:microcystin-dependent protein